MKALCKYASLALVALLAAGGLAAVTASAQDGNTPTLDEIIAMNLEAKGGEEKVRSVETARVTGTMTMGGGQMQAPFTWEWMAPDKMRTEFTVQGMTAVQAYDGETGWMIMPFAGKTEPEKMPDSQASQIREQSDFAGPLVDPEEKGYELELLGEEEVDGTPAYKIRVTHEDGNVTYLYLDKDYGLEIQSEAKRTTPAGQEVETVTSIGDYKEVGGLMIAHSYDVQIPGMPAGQNMTFESVELNPELDASRFEMPGSDGDDSEDAGDTADSGENDGR